MRLIDLVERVRPGPWQEGDNIPWNEPGFSQRMLREHLTQEHDHASRRSEQIDQHVRFIHQQVLGSRTSGVLDLGCGPGLYLQRLAKLGHTCCGIDFSPASIEYARAQAASGGLPIQYVQADLRQADFGSDFDLVMNIYGEFNVFKPEAAQSILKKAHAALVEGGSLLLEPSPEAYIRQLGSQPPAWWGQSAGLFSDTPHIVLEESFWDEDQRAATNRMYVIDAATGDASRYAASYQAYSDDQFRALLASCGFREIQFLPDLAGTGNPSTDFIVIHARK